MTTELVLLKDVLRLSIDSVPVDSSKTYPIAGVYSFGRGLLSRAPLLGSETTYKTLNRLHLDDFVLSQLKAWEGALTKVTDSYDGWFLSPQFPTFRAIPGRLDISYLDWYCKQAKVWDELRSTARGMGARRDSVSPERFLSLRIPLPPLLEQRRIVGRIQELAAKINEARELRRKVQEEPEMLVSAAMNTYFDFAGSSSVVGDYAKVQGGYAFSSDEYNQLGSHQIVRIGNVRDGFLDLSRAPVHWSPRQDSQLMKYELNAGDLVITMTGTRNKRDYGFIGKVPMGKKLLLNQRVGRLAIRKEVDPDYLFHFLRSPFFRDRLFRAATGTANQANVGNNDIECVPFAPPQNRSEQRRVVEELDALQAHVSALKKLQAVTSAELDALIPSILDKAFRGEL